MNKEPTEAQIKGFWEGLGLEYRAIRSGDGTFQGNIGRLAWFDRDGKFVDYAIPIDLNNLFKYAVDEALNQIQNDEPALYPDDALQRLFDLWMQLMEWYDTEIALFWTIWEVMKCN